MSRLVLLLLLALPARAADPLTLKGHTRWVGGVAFSPDGKSLATASGDGSVRFWDPVTGKPTATLDAHPDSVTAVAFSADGTLVATSSFDGTAKVWDAATRKLRQTFKGHRGAVQTVAFDPRDNRFVTTGGVDGTVRVWHLESGVDRGADPHKSWANAVAFNPAKFGRFASVSSDNTLCVRSGDGKVVMQLRPRAAELRSVAYSPDGKRIAAGTRYGPVKVWDAETGDEVATLKGHSADVWAVAFSRDAKTLASGNGDWDRPGDIRLWDTSSWKEKGRLRHTGEVLSLAFSPTAAVLAAGSWDGAVRVWVLDN